MRLQAMMSGAAMRNKTSLVFACVVLALCLVPSMAQTAKRVPPTAQHANAFTAGKRFAVVVGIGDYPEPSGLSTLQFAAADAREVGAVLSSQGYRVKVLTDAQALRNSIESMLESAAEVVDREDGTLLFYFSGHGFAVGDKNYLATYETSVSKLAATGLSFTDVKRLLDASPAKRKIILLDACRNDAGGVAKAVGARSFTRFAQAEGLKILFSTKLGSFSYEDKSLGHGLFTHFLLQGLNGAAADAEGNITFDDLKDYTQDKVSSYAFEKGWKQVPFDSGEATGDFLVARTAQTGLHGGPPQASSGVTAAPRVEARVTPSVPSASGAGFEDLPITVPAVLARVDGQEIRAQDVRFLPTFAKIRQQAFASASTFVDDRIAEVLTEEAGRAEGRTGAEWLTSQIERRAITPSQSEIAAFYEANRSKLQGKTLEQARDQIIASLKTAQNAKTRREIIDSLKAKASVSIYLEPVRTPVGDGGRPSRGSSAAPVTIIEFSDFQCPFCARAQETLTKILDAYRGQVRLVARNFPLSFHAKAQKAAEAAECALEQGRYWPMSDKLYANQASLDLADLKRYASEMGLDLRLFSECLDSGRGSAAISQDKKDGEAAGLTGTPAFFINGRFISGAQPFESFKRIIDDELTPSRPKPGRPGVLAQVNGVEIRRDRWLDASIGLRGGAYDVLRTAVDEAIDDLLAAGAAKRVGMESGAKWLEGEVQKRADLPEATRRSAVLSDLRTRSDVAVYLDAPRFDVKDGGNPSKGPAAAPVTIIEFGSYQCPYSAKSEETLRQLLESYGNRVRLVFRDFPLSFQDKAQKAAEAAGCALEQNRFWDMHARLFSNQGALDRDALLGHAAALGLDRSAFASCLDSGRRAAEIAKDLADGQAAGITGTPAFFVNGRYLGGSKPFDKFKEIIDGELARREK